MTELESTMPSEEERTLALLAHGLSFVEGGVVAPLLLYIFRDSVYDAVYKDRPGKQSEFVAFHSLQSLYFGLIFLAISLPVALLTCGWGLLFTLPFYFVYEVIACMQAHTGEWYELPFAGPLAAKVHPPPDYRGFPSSRYDR